MIFAIMIDVPEEEFKRCIATAWLHRYGDKIKENQIKDFAVRDVVNKEDVRNMLLGSSLGELCSSGNVIMQRVE